MNGTGAERVVILHGAVGEGPRPDDADTLVQAEAIGEALAALGHAVETVPLTLDLAAAADRLRALAPAFVFNLVESVDGCDAFLPLGPMLLDRLGLRYTGCGTRALTATTDKLLAKRLMCAAGIPTPDGGEGRDVSATGAASFGRVPPPQPSPAPQGRELGQRDEVAPSPAQAGEGWGGGFHPPAPDRYIVKSVTEHASFGLDAGAVVPAVSIDATLADRRSRYGGDWFAEAYIEGREFNLSLLAGPDGPQVLPPAEIEFLGFAPGEPRILGYAAKWDESSGLYHATPRRGDFPAADRPLLDRLAEIARDCWTLFGLSGYARVDFRVDADGEPFVLEVNANPCLSPDAGFAAAAERAGLDFVQVIGRIVADVSRREPGRFP